MTRPVYVDPQCTDIAVGAHYTLRGDEGRHAATVRRTSIGEQIDVVDGNGTRLTLEVTGTAKTELSAIVRDKTTDAPHQPLITLVQALAKGGRDEQAIETATEFGVDEVIPWQSSRTVVKWAGDTKIAKSVARWQATVQAAAKQSRRSWIPHVGMPVTSRELLELIKDRRARGVAVFVCHEQATDPLLITLDKSVTEIMLIVGPEGGISDEECDLFVDAGAQLVLLGEHVLRSATAGPWAIAAIRALPGKAAIHVQ
ncbi:MAG: 16S rRNA (uracil(1498)-N(3))-methyltransferase [Actinomycetaceae bacterium]|nr:16S rRNA (uracil(1498)-N(3))-methyltransferase [Actinomycetaceae bacterium]